MCMMCDGASPEEVIDRYVELVDEHGWMTVAVDGTPRSPGWAYTIGLTETYGHPELAMVTCSATMAQHQFQAIVQDIEMGHVVAPGRHDLARSGSVTCRGVDPNQLAAGLIAYWPRVASRLGWDMTVPDVIQIEARDVLCPKHDRIEWDLSRAVPAFTDASTTGGLGFRRRKVSSARTGSASRRKRASGDPRNRPSRWAS